MKMDLYTYGRHKHGVVVHFLVFEGSQVFVSSLSTVYNDTNSSISYYYLLVVLLLAMLPGLVLLSINYLFRATNSSAATSSFLADSFVASGTGCCNVGPANVSGDSANAGADCSTAVVVSCTGAGD